MFFKYDKDDVLKDLCMEFKQGNFYGIVGKSGCGKTTIAKLLTKRLNQYQGNILLNQHEIKDLDDDVVFKHITYISENNYLYKGSVRDNLRIGNSEADDQMFLKVLDIVSLDLSLDLELNENGSNLSGGQRQRLALARALLTNKDVYIFDEATSNIDSESETKILDTIHMLAKDKIVIMISHRLENIKDASYIYVLEDGKIQEEGNHTSLLAYNRIYATLYQDQYYYERELL